MIQLTLTQTSQGTKLPYLENKQKDYESLQNILMEIKDIPTDSDQKLV